MCSWARSYDDSGCWPAPSLLPYVNGFSENEENVKLKAVKANQVVKFKAAEAGESLACLPPMGEHLTQPHSLPFSEQLSISSEGKLQKGIDRNVKMLSPHTWVLPEKDWCLLGGGLGRRVTQCSKI